MLPARARQAETLAGVVLAGGRSLRMGGRDKALLTLAGQPLVQWCVDRLRPQVGALVLNVNTDPGRFGWLGLPTVQDAVPDYPGPLAGVLAAMRWAAQVKPDVQAVVSVSADAPFIPRDLVGRLREALAGSDRARVAVAQSRGRRHPVIALWKIDAAADIAAALERGDRRVETMVDALGAVSVPFADVTVGGREIDPFLNINSPEDLASAEELIAGGGGAATRPFVFAVAGWKNSGKTTLVERLVAHFVKAGYSVATVKHTHHDLSAGERGTDSGRHRAAGAQQSAVVAPSRWMLDGAIHVEPEPPLADVLARLALSDLVIVEGYKSAPLPKIEVRRTDQNAGPPLAERDPGVFAIAADYPLAASQVRAFNLDDIEGLAAAVLVNARAAGKLS